MSIQVIVAGTTGKGKSSIAALISKTLKEAGLEVTLLDDGNTRIVEELPGVVEATLEDRMSSLVAKNIKVEVNTLNLLIDRKLGMVNLCKLF